MPLTLSIIEVRVKAEKIRQARATCLRNPGSAECKTALAAALLLEEELLASKNAETFASFYLFNDLVTTGSPQIVERTMMAHRHQTFELGPREWTWLLTSSTPDLVDHMIATKLSPRWASIPLLTAILAGESDWIPILESISHRSGYAADEVLESQHVDILTGERSAPHVAKFLRARVCVNPTYFANFGAHCANSGDFFRAIVLHLAGVPIESMKSKGGDLDPVARAFYAALESNHARLRFNAIFPSLEQFLTCGDLYERWAADLVEAAEKQTCCG